MKEASLGIKLLITDCDGVLTDAGVYYSANGEEMKRFSIRDGMGVERLRNLAGIETAIITGELSGSVRKRAEKLKITELHLGIKDKVACLQEILSRKNLQPAEIAYIGDDYNDLEVLQLVGLSACPADGLEEVKSSVDYICANRGGNGAFREFAEFIIRLTNKKS
ncbi:MAG: HAD-IIIA family hydrolase [Saprospiraceae bacterium]|nr:HAD-IIIA family hydrolase [Saprospiraceae bacterium]MCB0623378.1 HAD-IIIA family hydrolase [Saprospiraceae bacterium]MCB0675832.1 HAD-IIIA family hydrolase [Saprospiraceae bacterium]MCB0682410.1 HAD-IIIA family hydrolase [Saprospiraceae bacterium]